MCRRGLAHQPSPPSRCSACLQQRLSRRSTSSSVSKQFREHKATTLDALHNMNLNSQTHRHNSDSQREHTYSRAVVAEADERNDRLAAELDLDLPALARTLVLYFRFCRHAYPCCSGGYRGRPTRQSEIRARQELHLLTYSQILYYRVLEQPSCSSIKLLKYPAVKNLVIPPLVPGTKLNKGGVLEVWIRYEF
eukprot:56783-Rhodomonas_salina.3